MRPTGGVRVPVKDVPCHKGCAETWITTYARGASDRALLIRAYTPCECATSTSTAAASMCDVLSPTLVVVSSWVPEIASSQTVPGPRFVATELSAAIDGTRP